MPIIVFNMNDEGMLGKVVEGSGTCTVLSNE
jgi:uridylate kinase